MKKLILIPVSLLSVVLASGCAIQSSHPDPVDGFVSLDEAIAPKKKKKAPLQKKIDEQIAQATDTTPDIWQRISSGYGFPKVDDSRLQNHLRWFSNNQQYIDRFTERSELYIHYVVSELEANNMPLELALLPIIESSYNPFAYSTHHAAGIWQFVPGTAKSFGLEKNNWYDGRRDIVASTDAAIRYLQYLNNLFDGDWLLAIAAYNAGEGTIRRAIEKNASEGKATDFWSLPLPPQTQAYVPQLVALSRIIAKPERYDLKLGSIPDDPYFVPVDINRQVNLAQLARLSETDAQELQQLNAGYSRWLTNPSGPHQILVPVSTADSFIQHIETLPATKSGFYKEYKVVSGDTLGAIARRFDTTVAELTKNNQLASNQLRIGQVLRIGQAGDVSQSEHPDSEELMMAFAQARQSNAQPTHIVKSGDSLWKIARSHNITVKQLEQHNKLKPGSSLKPGQRLLVPTTSLAARHQLRPTDDPEKMSYRIQSGDTLSNIAARFKVSTQDILQWNSVKDASYIHPGQTLTLIMKGGL